MAIVGIGEMLRAARAGGYAVPGFCAWNAETIRAVLHVAQEQQAPVIVLSGPKEFPLLAPSVMGAIARAEARNLSIPVAIHLDHGDSLQMVRDCLDARYSSVMLDASRLPFEDNVALSRQATEMAHAQGADAEAEIGAVGRVGDTSVEGDATSTLTDPDEAARFVSETGVDALAISIGNAHGIYAGLPKLDFERLEQIAARVEVPLVLHGGSGTPDEDIQRAIELGITKVNVASELGKAFRETLVRQWCEQSPAVWTPTALTEAVEAYAEVVRGWVQRTGAAGRAATGERQR